jgi:rSAM/selenodomain-associated transferase 1
MAFPTESHKCLIVFAKTPIRGRVKTRMRPFLSEDDCLRLHSLLLRLWLGRLREWDLGQVHKALFLTPKGADRANADLVLDVPQGVAVETQQGQDLGDRLSHAFDQKWNQGFRKLVFIGTDSPALGIEDLHAAFEALDANEVVLGPATDGGYYLIGFSARLPMLFSRISWGTSEVFRETVQFLEANAIRWKRLRESFDLDTYEDLVNFHRLLRESPTALPSPDGQELVAFVAHLVTSSGTPQCL